MTALPLAATLIAAIALGAECSIRLWPSDEERSPRYAERVLYAFLLGSLLWLASTWLLAITHLLRGPFLIARTVAFLALAGVLLVRRRRSAVTLDGADLLYVIMAIPLFMWVVFSLWRGMVTPPASIDALSYHLPKSIHYVRAAGYERLQEIRFLLGWRPANYELLLADAIAMAGRDDVTEWISVFFYGAFVIAAVALGQRWHRWNPAAATVTGLLAGSLPVLLLHTAEYKNDVMAAFFMSAAMVAAGRWWSEQDPRALMLALVSIAAAAGTKTPAAIFAAIAIPFLLWPLIVRRIAIPLRRLAALLIIAGLLSMVVGGMSYVERVTDRFQASGNAEVPATRTDGLTYGHYSNLWKGPYLLLFESFAPNPRELNVPWSPPWVWHRYEMYYSELGVAFTLAALAVPLAIWKTRPKREAVLATIVIAASFAAILPFDAIPRGRYLIGLPRFALPLAPVVFGWTIGPLVDWLGRRGRAAIIAALSIAAGLFSWYAWRNAMDDTFAPIDFVMAASRQPGRRLPPIGYGRAASVLDEWAGPRDHVAFDGGISSLLHPAYGATLERRVDLIAPGRTPPQIPEGVQWVIVDRMWNMVWGDPHLNDLTQKAKIGRGRPSDHDLRVFRALQSDPRFELVFFNPAGLQAVFRRR